MSSETKRVRTGTISPNPLNPRIFFREEEMDALKESISRLGILVPLVVYQSAPGRYTLLDGERRLKCATELGLRQVPVNVTAEPDETENILLMFNIHSLREQWDPYTIAMALERLMEHLSTRNSKELAALTGFSIGSINRSKKLLRLPRHYLDQVRQELAKPKSQQRLTEDFFLELGDAVSAIRKHHPSLYSAHGETALMDEFVRRRKSGKLPNIVDLRIVADVANFERSGLSQEKSFSLLERIVARSDVALGDVYEDLVQHNKQAKSVIVLLDRVIEALGDLNVGELNATTLAELRSRLTDVQRVTRTVRAQIGDR